MATSPYGEIYRNPFAEPRHRARGAPYFPAGKRGTGLHRRGRRKFGVRLPPFFNEPDLEARAVPASSRPDASILERIFIKELLKRNLVEGVDWLYQAALDGGHSTPGGIVPDFAIVASRSAVEVQGQVWHSGLVPYMHEITKEAIVKSLGFNAVFYLGEQTLRSDELTQNWLRSHLGM